MKTTDPIIKLTEVAAEKILELMLHQTDGSYLRVFITGGGCSGLNYGMTFDEKDEEDFEFTSKGVAVLVDPFSAPYIKGTEIDWESSLMGTGFKINNPNAQESCSCGSSFST